jgi:anti-sigma B factor antagonist
LTGEPQPFFARRRPVGDATVVELGGECDASTLDELNRVLREAAAGGPTRVLVDLSQVTFIDSMTLGSLVAAAKTVRAAGGTLEVVGSMAPEVRHAFELTGLASYLLVDARG